MFIIVKSSGEVQQFFGIQQRAMKTYKMRTSSIPGLEFKYETIALLKGTEIKIHCRVKGDIVQNIFEANASNLI